MGIITDSASIWLFLMLDITAKVIYAFYAAANLENALRQARKGVGRA